MNEEYLWDKAGKEDPEIVYLENLLGELRWSGRQGEAARTLRVRHWTRMRHTNVLAAAAAVAVLLGAVLLVRHKLGDIPSASWELSIGGHAPKRVRTGQVIATGLDHATMQSDLVGQVTIEPNSRLRLLAMKREEHRLALDYGTIHAFIWAPPAKFVIDTPTAKAVDLGCQYTLSVTEGGSGFLTVQLGWVAFQWNGVESFIPRGAACRTRIRHGPDTPYFLDAPQSLTKPLAEFDRTGNMDSLRAVLANARARDGLTLWHLLQRTRGSERAEVYQRFAELVHLPAGVTRDSIERGDIESMDKAWEALNLGTTSWWREWKRDW